MEKEIRNLGSVELQDESRKVEGYAIVFGTPSNDLGGFVEVIQREALDDDILLRSDILALLDHSIDRGILARSRQGKGSLQLTIDERGLKYEFEAPKTQLGDEVLEYLRRGDINQSSFAFTVADQEWVREGDKYIRNIKKFDKLFDVSAVYSPAYNEASVGLAMRSLKEFKESETKEDLTEYYNNLRNLIK